MMDIDIDVFKTKCTVFLECATFVWSHEKHVFKTTDKPVHNTDTGVYFEHLKKRPKKEQTDRLGRK